LASSIRFIQQASRTSPPPWVLASLVFGAEMADQGVAISILLTSNVQVLGVSDEDHPFITYLDAGVPVMLGTNDQGISRAGWRRLACALPGSAYPCCISRVQRYPDHRIRSTVQHEIKSDGKWADIFRAFTSLKQLQVDVIQLPGTGTADGDTGPG